MFLAEHRLRQSEREQGKVGVCLDSLAGRQTPGALWEAPTPTLSEMQAPEMFDAD